MREARRRRIIENSEKRLQRILGVTTGNDEGIRVNFSLRRKPTRIYVLVYFQNPINSELSCLLLTRRQNSQVGTQL